MQHIGETLLRYLDREPLDLTGPDGNDTSPHSREGKSSDAVKQTPHGQGAHFVTAAAMVRVVLTAA